MSVTRGNAITQADMDALATLANTKLATYLAAQSIPDFEFSYMDGGVLPPTDVNYTASAPGGAHLDLPICLRVYSYKLVSGRRHYSKTFATGYAPTGDGTFTWTWTPPAGGADGYIVIWSGGARFARPIYSALSDYTRSHYWRDEPAAGFSDLMETGAGGPPWWNSQVWFFSEGPENLHICPVEWGQWRWMMEWIKRAAYADTPPTENHIISGPWCVSVGEKLQLIATSGRRAYGEIEFYYAQNLHSGAMDVEVSTGITGIPLGSLSGTIHSFPFAFTGAGASRVTIRLSVSKLNSGGGSYVSTWTFGASGGTIISITPSTPITDSAFGHFVDVVADIPSGSATVTITLDLSTTNLHPTAGSVTYAVSALTVVTITPVSGLAIHPSSAGSKLRLSADLGVEMPVIVLSGMTTAAHVVNYLECPVDGVWVAKTLPVFCVNTYLESKIPTAYSDDVNSGGDAVPSQRGSAPSFYDTPVEPSVNPVTPAVAARPSLWPVFRDTDMLTWRAYPGSSRDYLVPFLANGVFSGLKSRTLAPGANLSGENFLAYNFVSGKIEVEGLTLPIYFSQSGYPDPDNPATYDGVVAGQLRMPSDYNPTPGSNILYTIRNDTLEPKTFNVRETSFYTWDGIVGGYSPGPVPVLLFHRDETRGAFERYSYNFRTPKNNGFGIQSEIPLSGYCISEIKIQRASVGGSVMQVPSVGHPELIVKIGLMRGVTNDNAGTFSELLSVTIPANAPSTTQSVFIPVLEGAALIYQAAVAVEVFASANFQPEFITTYVITSSNPANTNQKWGTYSGTPISTDRLLKFYNESYNASGGGFTESFITFPACATVYNDLEALLNEL